MDGGIPLVTGYRIEGELGRGGMGVVYLARQIHLDRRVALKVLSPKLGADEKFRERFVRESHLAASLTHPNIVTIHDAGERDNHLFIAMQYIEGHDLRSRIKAEGPLDPALALQIIRQTAAALDFAHHAGLVHRDVKPANIMLSNREAPGGNFCYLTDFGLSRHQSSEALTSSGEFLGTFEYLPPEQVGGRTLDGRADLYSLGCVFFEILCGRSPYQADSDLAVLRGHMMDSPPSVNTCNPDLPTSIDLVIAQALAKDPADRFSTCAEFAEAAEAALSTGIAQGSQAPATLPPKESRSSRSNRSRKRRARFEDPGYPTGSLPGTSTGSSINRSSGRVRTTRAALAVLLFLVGMSYAIWAFSDEPERKDVSTTQSGQEPWQLPPKVALTRFTIRTETQIGVFEGNIAAREAECVENRRIELFRLTTHDARIAGATHASSSGDWSVKTTGMPGYYVAVAEQTGDRETSVICKEAASPPARASVLVSNAGQAAARSDLVSLLKNAATALESHAFSSGTYHRMDGAKCDAYRCDRLLTSEGFTGDSGYVVIDATDYDYCIEGQHINSSLIMVYRSNIGKPVEGTCFKETTR